jgi:4'-phosphopantetheinyl transferase
VTSPLTWPASSFPGIIAPDEVHLWAWALQPAARDLSAHLEILDRQEQERVQRFHFVADAERYAVAHGNLRRILGAYLNLAPERLCFRNNQFGKPELAGETTLKFNLSHSKSIAVLAVDHSQPVGVDVEDVRPIEAEVADGHFSATELTDLRGLQGEDWLAGFYRCWTRKEAILKAEGVGLSRALDSFDVSLLPDKKAELISTRQRFSYPWRLHDVSPSSGSIGALATAQAHPRLGYFRC